MKITFLGATHEVTGSLSYIEVGGHKFLVDCGMEQGKDIFVNQSIPVKASEIEALFLTHAHIDHSGNIPLLYKQGFRGSIYATEATVNLCRIMLLDSAGIQESEAEWKNRKNMRAGKEETEPIYTTEDAEKALKLFVPMPFGLRKRVLENVDVRFGDAGHLLGASHIELWLTENGETRKLVMSGDIGNMDRPLIRDPQPVDSADYLVLESTYGDRLHAPHEGSSAYVNQLTEVLNRTFKRGGNVVIPSFAVGRTQELLYFFREIKAKKLVTALPDFRVFVDSPLAVEATAVFQQTPREYFNDETREVLDGGANPIFFDGLNVSVSTDESIAINNDLLPKVILSSSGMCEAGRIRHHLKHNLWRPESTILFVGYQTAGTLGRLLLDGAKSVKLFGEEIVVKAEIAQIGGISGHGDRDILTKWLTAIPEKPKKVFINHGEDASVEFFSKYLTEQFGYETAAPYSGTSYDLLTGECITETEGIPIADKAMTPEQIRNKTVYDELMAAADRLRQMASSMQEHSNKELQKLTKDIDKLYQKYTGAV